MRENYSALAGGITGFIGGAGGSCGTGVGARGASGSASHSRLPNATSQVATKIESTVMRLIAPK